MATRKGSTVKAVGRKGYGAALYSAIEAAGGHYCAACNCYVGAGHSICDPFWFARSVQGAPIVMALDGNVVLAGSPWADDDPAGPYAPTVPEPMCEAVSA